jgi:Dolichyl-phosphate-mannose-protein mannosyltransferase
VSCLSSSQLLRDFLVAPAGNLSRGLETRRSKLVWILFLLIVLIAAYLRLASLNLAEFKSDEAGTSIVLKALVQQAKVPLVGPPLTTGGNAGPVYYYILAIPFLISTNPMVASAFVAVLNIVGVAFTFKFAREFFNERIALIATALDAVSPFAVLFSRKIWNPDLIFPFTVMLFYCLYAFVIKGKPKYLVPILVLYAVILQIHPITLFLAPVILLFLAKFRSRIRLRYLFVGVALFVLLFAPFVYGEVTNGFRDVGSFASTFKDFQFHDVNVSVFGLLSADTSGTGFDYILGSSAPSFFSSILHADYYFIVENICLYLGFALVLVRASREPFGENARYSILLAWIAIPTLILLFFNPTFGLYTHDLVMLFPANFLMVAVLFDYAMTRKGLGKSLPDWPKIARISAILILVSILLAQITFGLGFLAFLNAQGGTAGDYGVGLQYKTEVAAYIAHNSNGSSFTISSSLTPGQIGVEYVYLLSLYDKTPASFANLNYVIIDNLSGLDPSLMQLLSVYPKVDFGPLTVYVVRS